MIEAYKKPSEKQLRSFGLLVGPLFAAFFGLGFPRLCERGFFNSYFDTFFCQWLSLGDGRVYFPFVFGAILFVGAIVHAKSLFYIHKPWMIVASYIGFVISQFILLLLFFGIFFPMGVAMKILGKDPMTRDFVRETGSYRVKKEPQTKDHMETPY